MKLNIALATLSLSASIGTVQCLLRGSSSSEESASVPSSSLLLESIGDSKCLSITDEDSCNTSKDDEGLSCVWCKCSAVPSECLNTEQAKNVPPGVFECATPNSTVTDVETDASTDVVTPVSPIVAQPSNPGDKRYDGSLMTYSLTDGEVDGSLCDPSSKSLSGYVDISGSPYDTDGNKQLFYWFFEKRSKTSNGSDNGNVADDEIPLILWLTGGPGCSSTLALLTENGPCSVNDDGTSTSVNPNSWTEVAHMIWLDQPAGVGYSAGTQNDYNEEMISEDAYYFLQGFFEMHPEYSTNPLFVVGESFGGHYAPAIAHKFWTKNKSTSSVAGMLHINLAGLAVGNGLTDPMVQYPYYPEMAYNNSHGMKVVTRETYDAMKEAVPKCVKLIEQCNAGTSIVNKFACQTAFVLCSVGLTSPYQVTGLNPYDIRKQCGPHPLCYDFTHIEKFLNLDSTKAALNVKEDAKWATCNMGINFKFHTDWMKSFSPFVKDLINDNIPTLIYAGDVDFICNYLGNRAWTLELDWDHKKEFNDSKEREWGMEGKPAAALGRSSHGFTFLQVYDAGHMVPSDQPEVALEMMKHFVSNGTF